MKSKLISHFIVIVAVMMAGLVTALAQVQPTFTTLSAAVADERAQRLTVTSATGFVASTGTLDYGMFVDREFMRITGVSGTTITVQRGQANTAATAHSSGARVFVGQYGSQAASGTQTGGPFVQNRLQGNCTRGSYSILPVIQVNANAVDGQAMYNCLGSVWRRQTLPDDFSPVPLVVCNIPVGSVALGSLGTNTADVANKMMRTSIWVPQTQVFTGIQVLQGGTATTDNISQALFDTSGLRIASGAAAGTLLAGADTFKQMAFALNRAGSAQTLTLVTGPALYYIGVTGNGATAGAYRTIAASTFNNVFTGSATSQTFGTFPDFTAPTTFTADVGPIACLYN